MLIPICFFMLVAEHSDIEGLPYEVSLSYTLSL